MGSSPILGTILKAQTANLFNFCNSQKVKTFPCYGKIMGSIPIYNDNVSCLKIFVDFFKILLYNIYVIKK